MNLGALIVCLVPSLVYCQCAYKYTLAHMRITDRSHKNSISKYISIITVLLQIVSLINIPNVFLLDQNNVLVSVSQSGYVFVINA